MATVPSPLLPPGRRPAAADGLRRRYLFGLDLVDAPDLDGVTDLVLADDGDDPAAHGLPLVVTPNVDIVVLLHRDPSSPEAVAFGRARIVLPDGMPLVLVSKLVNQPLVARLTGSELFHRLWPALGADKRPVVAVCATREIADGLVTDSTGAAFVVPPLFDPADPVAVDAVVGETIDRATEIGARHVFFGLGHPRDALLGAELCRRWDVADGPTPWCLGVGGSLAMYTGVTKRAPAVVQRLGVEWLYRFGQEPRRLFTRYFVRDLGFLPIVAGEVRLARRRRWKESNHER